MDLYNQKLEAGFASSTTGTTYTFGYADKDQAKFTQLAILDLKGMLTYPINIPAKDGTMVPHTQAQYNQLVTDIAVFAQMQNTKEHNYINQVNAATTIDQVNEITVSF